MQGPVTEERFSLYLLNEEIGESSKVNCWKI